MINVRLLVSAAAMALLPLAPLLSVAAQKSKDPSVNPDKKQPEAKQPEVKIGDFYPMRVGTKWTYSIEGREENFVVEVSKSEKIGDVNAFVLEAKVKGNTVASETIATQKDGIYRYRFGENAISPAIVFCKLPAKKAESWTQEFEVNGVKAKVKFQTDIQDVKVPAGEYKDVVVVKGEVEENGRVVKTSYYFAAKLGMVKQVIEIGDNKIVLELEKVEFPK